ncbi:TetR/AcrR family transcriptional regulator [Pseudonocardia humida]|uniref:TetR/AcrR family transcriptional regulator n=1 Tax=Pseudonocardia humida TaxID=2800819 RepID=A0ABT1AAW5_9PSEU|nr:TetR/AcrR family transcriptional regulator [Pseudonocardia humida]MCO1659954.1 TetR/AcrR family transcriptional regulator [Pseudonocardia humida]
MPIPPPHRPGGRSARITRAVHAATVHALTEHGLDGLSIEAVAARAEVNKTTIYRRWGTREALVADALTANTGRQVTVPDTGSSREDLVVFARQVRDAILAPTSRALMSALSAGRHHRELAEIGRRYWADRLAAVRPLIERAVQRGELPADADPDVVVTRIVGPIWFAVSGPGLAVDDDFVAGCVDTVLAGTTSPAAGDQSR